MAIAGNAKPCFRYEAINGELQQISLRQEMSTKTLTDVGKIIERLRAGDVVHVSARYPVPQQVRAAWAEGE